MADVSIEVRDREIEVVCLLDAPRELIFRAYSDGEALKAWFGPEEWPLTISRMDFRPGGRWHYCMTGPDGQEGWGIALYEEIVPPERIVYRDAFSDADGNVIPPESTATISIEERADGSLLRWVSVYASNDARDQVLAMGVEAGITSTLNNLERYLAEVRAR
jgi:uncharacterized protein YndB with AHSA1/START domain